MLIDCHGRSRVKRAAGVGMLGHLERIAQKVRVSVTDRKWDELFKLLENNRDMFDAHGRRRKLVIFSEHRDTLNYLDGKIKSLLMRRVKRE